MILALTPFWKSQSTFWLSSDVRDIGSLGYTYPEFQGLDMSNKQAVRDSMLRTVNRLYGSGSAQTKRDLEAEVEHAIAEGASTHALGHSHSRRHRQISRSLISQLLGGTFSDWTARVAFKRHELGHSFSVLLFLDKVPDDPKEWLVSSNLAGAHHAFVHSMANNCTTCPDRKELVEEGFVHLNSWIAEYTALSSFDSAVVEPFLKQKLQWRVIKVRVVWFSQDEETDWGVDGRNTS